MLDSLAPFFQNDLMVLSGWTSIICGFSLVWIIFDRSRRGGENLLVHAFNYLGILLCLAFAGLAGAVLGGASIDHMGKMFFSVALGLFCLGSVSFIVALSHYWYQNAAQGKDLNPSN